LGLDEPLGLKQKKGGKGGEGGISVNFNLLERNGKID